MALNYNPHDPPPPNSRFIVFKEWYRTDDNGDLYAHYNKAEKRWELLPNTKYTLNGYFYETNEDGSISHSLGTISLTDEERNALNAKIRGMRSYDDRGHVFAHKNNGADEVGNLAAMSKDLNRGEYKELELYLAQLTAEGHDVREVIDPVYESDPLRPDYFEIHINIDGYDFDELLINDPELERVLNEEETVAEDADMEPAEESTEIEEANLEPAEDAEEVTQDPAVNMEAAVTKDAIAEEADPTPAVESAEIEDASLIPEGFEEAVANAASATQERSAEMNMAM